MKLCAQKGCERALSLKRFKRRLHIHMQHRSIGFMRLILCGPYINVHGLGRLAMTSRVFGRRYDTDTRLISREHACGLSLIEEVIRIRCNKIEGNGVALHLSPSRSAWKRLLCLTESTAAGLVVKNNEIINYEYYNLPDAVIVPHGVTSIGEHAFHDCMITSIILPAGVTTIGDGAFHGCSHLTALALPAGVKHIAKFVFDGCAGLISLTLSVGVTTIGNCAFQSCSSLTSLIIPDGVTTLGEGAFSYCSDLTSVTIPNSVYSIEEGAFYYCSSLTSLTIPADSYELRDCCSLVDFIVPYRSYFRATNL
jgi:hypothetical protein